MAEVHLNDGENLESALKRFKRKVLQENIIQDIKSHALYLKPGQKKCVTEALARKRARKKRSGDSDSDQGMDTATETGIVNLGSELKRWTSEAQLSVLKKCAIFLPPSSV